MAGRSLAFRDPFHFSPLHLDLQPDVVVVSGWAHRASARLQQIITLLLIGAVIPNLLEYLVSGPDFGGLSAVVNTLVGYSWVLGRRRPEGGVQLQDGIFGFMVIWLIIGFSGVLGNNLANVAHLEFC